MTYEKFTGFILKNLHRTLNIPRCITQHQLPLEAEIELVVGLEIRRQLLEKLGQIQIDVINKTHVCKHCRSVFISRRRGRDIKWCEVCKKS